ncbi:TlpA family protein disulfide reductase [bacterium]|nr:TlpA family protein disulfide reductase [bacterium]
MTTDRTKRMPLLIILAMVIMSMIFIFGCTAENNVKNTTREPIKSASSGEKAAPDFTVTTIDGGKITLSDYKGKKAVLIDIWGTWCAPCRIEMPELQKFYEKHPDEVEIIAAAQNSPLKDIQAFVKENKISFKIVLDSSGTVSRKYRSKYIPFLTVISKEGKILKTFVGMPRDLEGELEKMLGLD